MTRNEAVDLLKGPYGREIGKIATDYTSVIFWAVPYAGSGETSIGNGSVFFLSSGKGFAAGRRSYPSLSCPMRSGHAPSAAAWTKPTKGSR